VFQSPPPEDTGTKLVGQAATPAGLLDGMADDERPEIRVERATDGARFLASDKLVWFDSPGTDPLEVQLRGVPEDQRFAAEVVGSDVDPATYAGIYAVRPMELSVPGGDGRGRAVPVAGLTWVGVHPDHRRRGLLTAMLRHHVEQTRREGCHLSALHASEPGIYGRHGYGLASLELEVSVGRGATLTAPLLEGEVATITTRLGTVDDPGMAERRRRIDLDLMATNVGTIVGGQEFYDELSHVTAEDVRDSEPPRVLVAARDGRDVGYAVFRRKHHWTDARPAAKVEVTTLAGGAAARLALLRRVTDLDLSGSVTVNGIGAGDPLLSWVQGPRGLGHVKPYDSLWVRLVDLAEAVAARGYEADCDVVAEVADPSAPWNSGRWRIRVEDGSGQALRSDDRAEVSLPVSALGAAYLGAGNLAEMQRAGLVDEHRPGAVADLWRAFRTDLSPYAARGF
jgi:predicted acetyltransferase